MRKLTDLCDIQYGYAFDSSYFTEDSSYIPIVRIRDVKRGFSKTHYSSIFPVEYVIHKGDLLVGMDGEFNIAKWQSSDALLNQRVCKLTAKEGMNKEYLRYAMIKALKDLENKTSFVTVKHLTAKELNRLELNVPSVAIQNQRENTLSALEKIMHFRSKQLKSLDDLIKARFIEMFGDILGDRTLPLIRLCELADIGSSKRIYANEYAESGIPFYRSKEIRELGTGLKPSIKLFIKQERYDEIREKYGVPKVGDILIAAIGATIGYSWIVDTTSPFYYKDGNLIILAIKDNVNPIFLNHTIGILIEDFKKKGVAGSAQLALTIEKLEKMMVVNPELELQNQFADFVKQVDKSREEVKRSLEKTQQLYDSLMQEYFG